MSHPRPEACNSEDSSGRGGEFNVKLSFGRSGSPGSKGLFPAIPEWKSLGSCVNCQDEEAEEVNDVNLKSFNHRKFFEPCHVS